MDLHLRGKRKKKQSKKIKGRIYYELSFNFVTVVIKWHSSLHLLLHDHKKVYMITFKFRWPITDCVHCAEINV